MINYPQTLKDLQAELHKYAHVGRADRPFRFAIGEAAREPPFSNGG